MEARGGAIEEEPATVWENERHYGIGWLPPVPLERPNFTDQNGARAAPPRSVLNGGQWAVCVGSATDLDGWQYASSFARIHRDRGGGRACMRLTDSVRRRQWVRLSELDAAVGRLTHMESRQAAGEEGQGTGRRSAGCAPGGGGGGGGSHKSHITVSDSSIRASPHTSAAVSVGRQTVKRIDAKMRAVRSFLALLQTTLKDKGIWGMPLDPVAYAVVYKRHCSDLIALQARMVDRAERAHCEVASRPLDNEPAVYTSVAAQEADKPDTPPAGTAAWKEPPVWLADSAPVGSSEMDRTVENLDVATRHARAAYGYPLSAGYLSSVNNAVYMGTFKNLQFDVAGGASAAANNSALILEAGLKEEDLLLSEWTNSVFRPCHYVAVDRDAQRIVIGIRGSLEPADLLTDTAAHSMEVSLAGVVGKVHGGMFAAATYVHCNTAEVLSAACERHPSWPLVVTGHSLGGGVAALLALLLKEPGGCPPLLQEGIHCVAVACPGVMCSALSKACGAYVTSVVLRHDFVPRLSAATVDLLMQELVEASPIRNLTTKIGEFFSSFRPSAPENVGPSEAAKAPQAGEVDRAESLCALELLPASPEGGFFPVDEGSPAAALGVEPPPDVPLPSMCRGEGEDTLGCGFTVAGAASAGGGGEAANEKKQQQGDHLDPHGSGGSGSSVAGGEAAGPRLSGAAEVSSEPPAVGTEDVRTSSFRDQEGYLPEEEEEAAEATAEAFAKATGIHVPPAEAGSPGHQNGDGRVSKFDLLFPAGTVLWIVQRDAAASSSSLHADDSASGSREPSVKGSSASQASDNATATTAEHGKGGEGRDMVELMDMAWLTSSVKAFSDSGAQQQSSGPPASTEGGGPKGGSGRTPMAELDWQPTFVECEPETFGRLHLHHDMIRDHLPDFYGSAVKTLRQWYSTARCAAQVSKDPAQPVGRNGGSPQDGTGLTAEPSGCQGALSSAAVVSSSTVRRSQETRKAAVQAAACMVEHKG
mmetsp:Transcript_26362/g.74128  ORF Transcript_26362/g.74128 Transcript_26362/m.74128 type:complete len:987 (-) Transcript_26362:118-3078(-)|eukprot:CAMPEP_0117675404 /NCGR_PEP_ID=MMETSP0804-20121206/15587_1 /TAXON_ID=1074897 /ORGANISM="Tetraselmis astigmatica, Strain CCMP880" /LENGTH=986 /DNA_ID=CAMNT_0005484405 /DNA_START=113 /DNA_END=3073 /DNA_ORIENTATION=+